MSTLDVTADNLNSVMEFDHVIQVHADGSVTDAQVPAPTLYDEELSQPNSTQWTLLAGYTGQYGYNGPLMHASEYIGGGLARDILAQPGYYVALVEYPTDGGEPDGWAVARMDTPA